MDTPLQTSPYRSLVRTLTRKNLKVLGASMLLSFVLIAVALGWTARVRQADAAELAAAQLANNVAAMLAFHDNSETGRELLLLQQQREVVALGVYHRDSTVFARLESVDAPTLPAWSWRSVPESSFDGMEIVVFAPVLVQGRVEGVVYLRERMQHLMQWFLQGLLVMSLLMIGVGLLAARWLVDIQKQALGPLVELSALAERVAHERNYRLRAQVVNHDEIGRLTTRFNELLKRTEIWQMELTHQLKQQAERGEQLAQLAHYDSLTGLANRLHFTQALQQLVSYSKEQQVPLALAFIDLDNFKFVNDHFGHDAGDAVLIEVSQRLSQAIRIGDQLCRLGGDEFALLLPNVTESQCVEQVCQRLVEQIRQPLLVKGEVMPVTLSIGVALCPTHADDPSQLLQCADEAMYQTKRAGKNGFQIYQPSASSVA